MGGGLIGCAAAWQIARLGARVLLVTVGNLNSGASGQNAGSLHFQMERRFLENGEALADQAAAVLNLNRLAISDWRDIQGELGQDLCVHFGGGLMVAETAAEVALLEGKVRREQQAGLSTVLLGPPEIGKLAPYLSSNIRAAAYLKDEGHADPKKVTPALATAAQKTGAQIAECTRLIALQRLGSGFLASAAGPHGPSQIRAGKVLLAAGVWTAEIASLLNLHLPSFPVALQMNATERVAPFIPHLIQHVGRRLSLKQAASGNILIGGGWPAKFRQKPGGGFDLDARPTLIETSLTANLRTAVDVVPELAQLNLIRCWTGATAITGDQLPIVGEISRLPGLFVAVGGSAFTMGLTFARLLGEAITGQQPDSRLDAFSPNRFGHLNSFMG